MLTTFVYVEEPIDFSVKKGDKEGAMKLIAKVYSAENDLTHEQIYQEKVEQLCSDEPTEESFWHVLTDAKVATGSWISIITAIFNNLSGIGIINIFATYIFESILKKGAVAKLTAK